MKTRILLSTLAIPATALGLFAQDKAIFMAQTGVTSGVMTASPQPGLVRFVNEPFMFGGSPVTGAPYSADEKTESVQTLGDGTHISNTTTTRTWRDSQGRTRREMTLQTGAPGAPGHTTIMINDPVAGTSYTLNPDEKVAHEMPLPKIALMDAAALKAKLRAEAGAGGKTVTQTQSYGFSTNGQNVEYHVVRNDAVVAAAPPQMKHEDLGDDNIESVHVRGTRDTATIPQGAVGNDRPMTTVSERWYSPDLQVEVKSVHSDPRMGQTTHTLSNISRSEPDSSLFAPPSDYKIETMPKPEIKEFHASGESHQ
jgi:hypothetical protein